MKNKLFVIIDNGHGKETKGKRSPIWKDGTQLFEYEFNRDVAQLIYLELFDLGIETTLLVPEECSVPLDKRCERANILAVGAIKKGLKPILISIHANAGKGTGWESWV